MNAVSSAVSGLGRTLNHDLLELSGVSVRLGEKMVLGGVSLGLKSGERVGLVGKNGVGKSILLRLLAGGLEPEEGRISRSPGLRLAYSPQADTQSQAPWRGTVWEVATAGLAYARGLEAELRQSEHALGSDAALERYAELTALYEAAGGYEAEHTLRGYLEQLGFGPGDNARDVQTLSGGQRARLGLAQALASRPDLLLLDEPSRYLDLPGKAWLGETLRRFPGALVLASHDRALLDAVTGRTLHMVDGTLTSYRGNYSRFRLQADHAAARALREARRLAHERRSLATRARQQPTRSARRSLERRLERLPAAPTPVPGESDPVLTLGVTDGKPGSLVLEAENLNLTLGGKALLRDVSLRLEVGDKVALVGPNGSGKTSLLRLLTGDLEPDPYEPGSYEPNPAKPDTYGTHGYRPEPRLNLSRGVRLAFFDQHGRGLEDGLPLGETLERSVSEGRAHSLLALVGLTDAYTQTPETLSSGQRARAGLAQLMAGGANLLLLDEPSEGLDIGSTETLEAALQDTSATVLLVSHDAALIEAVATRVLGLSEGRLLEYRGGLPGYYAGTLRLEPDLSSPGGSEPDDPESGIPGESRRTDEADTDITEPRSVTELERLEDESAAIDDRLYDPLSLTERERLRLGRRLHELTALRAERYDAQFPPPLPRYRVLERGLQITTDADTVPIILANSPGAALHLYIDAQSRVAHLTFPPSADAPRCLLPWVETALIRGALRLAFEHLEVRTLQVQAEHDLSRAGLLEAGAGWWVLDRERYAEREGLVRTLPPPAPGPKKRRRRRRKAGKAHA